MWEEHLGPIRCVVEHRNVGGDRGPTLRVYDQPAERELLRFDCFERTPHFHIDPGGKNRVTPLSPQEDTIEVVLEELGRDLEGYLKRAGLELPRPLDRAAVTALLERAQAEMRNPPVDLDAIELSELRRREGEKWSHYPPDVLPAWVADMDFPVPDPVRRALLAAVERSDVGYALEPWKTGLCEAFVERMQERFDWTVDPGRIEILTDVVQGIYVGLEAFTQPEEGVVIQTPVYPPFLQAIHETGRRMITNPLVQGSERYEIDLDGLRNAVDASTRVLLLCNPHNPSGRVFSRGELESIAEVVVENDLVVISDEIHQDLLFEGARHVPFAVLGPEVEARTITLTSASKTFSIAGLRCAIAAFGSEGLKERFLGIPRHLRGGIGSMGMQATLAAWQHGQPWLERVLVHLRANRDHVAQFVGRRWPRVVHFPPEATYLSWLDFRALELPGGPARFFFERARVALSNGKFFGPEGVGFARLNFATSRPILDQVLDRMDEALSGDRPG